MPELFTSNSIPKDNCPERIDGSRSSYRRLVRVPSCRRNGVARCDFVRRLLFSDYADEK
jgi:hypothetical protein